MNIFEQASRQKLRISTSKGFITVEDLWSLSITSTKGPSLDAIYGDQKAYLRAMETDSLASTGANPARAEAELVVSLVEHVAAVKREENARAKAKAEAKQELARLLEIKAKRQDDALGGLSDAELEERIAAAKSA